MGEFRLPHRTDTDRNAGEKWDECCRCGPRVWRALIHFDSGSVSPTVGETVTGATSTDTGVIANVTLISGTYAGGDAVGVIEMTSPTGYDTVLLEIFTDNETLNGSTSGVNFATVNKTGAVQVWGRLIPDSNLIEYEGRKYCAPHFEMKFRPQWKEDEKVDYDEGDRE